MQQRAFTYQRTQKLITISWPSRPSAFMITRTYVVSAESLANQYMMEETFINAKEDYLNDVSTLIRGVDMHELSIKMAGSCSIPGFPSPFRLLSTLASAMLDHVQMTRSTDCVPN